MAGSQQLISVEEQWHWFISIRFVLLGITLSMCLIHFLPDAILEAAHCARN